MRPVSSPTRQMLSLPGLLLVGARPSMAPDAWMWLIRLLSRWESAELEDAGLSLRNRCSQQSGVRSLRRAASKAAREVLCTWSRRSAWRPGQAA